MRFFKALGVLLLLAVPCLLLAWGAVAIGQSAGIVVGTESAPAQPAQTPSATNPVAYGGGGRSGGGGYVQSRGASGVMQGSSGPMRPSDPLKDVSDLTKATAGQLQIGDQYLESKTRDLAQQYAGTEDAEAKAKLKAELTQTIEKHFDVRHEIRKQEIDQLEARVKKLREHLAKRGEARQSIVQMRLGQFISAAEGLGWDADFGGGRSSRSGAAWNALQQSLPGSSSIEYQKLEDLLEQSRRVVPQSSSQNAPAEKPPEPMR